MFASGQSRFPLTVGTKDFATYGQDGQKASDIRYPFRLVFEAQVSTPERNPQWPGWTEETKAVPFQQDLVDSLTQSDQLLFNVYAYDQPQEMKDPSNLQLIGKIYSASEAVNSLWADEQLLFAHMAIEEDMESQPEWRNYLPEYTPNVFEIDWFQEKNPEYVVQASRPSGPIGMVKGAYKSIEQSLQNLFYTRPRCPYGFK